MAMNPAIFQLAAELTRRGERFVLAHVVRREAPSSARLGDTALVTERGEFHGWLGGSCTRATVVREARNAIAGGQPRLIRLSPHADESARAGVNVYPMTCHSGGTVDIYIQPVLPVSRLVVFGVSPVARALARIGRVVGYRVDLVGDDADAAAVPGETEPILTRHLLSRGEEPVAAVVATFGEDDEGAVEAAFALAPVYLGVIASRARFQTMRDTLLGRGLSAEGVDRIKSPAGLDIGAETPEEIALSILAEIVRERRRHGGETREVDAREPGTVLDPVCGMSVVMAEAKHAAQVDGRTYYFCGGGCRTRFLVEPARYAVAEAVRGES